MIELRQPEQKGDAKMIEDRVPEELELKVSVPDEAESGDELVLTPSPEEGKPDDELILTPSPEEEEPEDAELILEAEKTDKAKEITFDGEEEAEDRVRKAMEEYDAAMDDAADAE